MITIEIKMKLIIMKKTLFGRKIISNTSNRSLNDKTKIKFNNESIIYQSTQNDEIKLDSSAEINIRIDDLLALI